MSRKGRWRWAALAQGAAAFPHDFPDAAAAVAEAARAAAAAAAWAAARPPGKRPPVLPRPPPWTSLRTSGAPGSAPGEAGALAECKPYNSAAGAADQEPGGFGTRNQGPGEAPAGGGAAAEEAADVACPMDVDEGDRIAALPPAAELSNLAQAPQHNAADQVGERAATRREGASAEPRVPAAEALSERAGQGIAPGARPSPCPAGLLPDGWFVARTPAALSQALAAAGSRAPDSGASPAPLWGRALARPAGAAAWRAPAPRAEGLGSGLGSEAIRPDLRCLVRVDLRMTGRGVAHVAAAVHLELASPSRQDPTPQRSSLRHAVGVMAAGGLPAGGCAADAGYSVAAGDAEGENKDPIRVGPLIGFVTSEAPPGAPAARGAVAVCQAAPLLALRGQRQGWGRAAQGRGGASQPRVLVVNPALGPARPAIATLCLEAVGNDVAAW